MTSRVGVDFEGNGRGAVTAARQVAGGIRGVREEASRSGPPLRQLDRDLGRAARGAISGSGAFRGLGRSIATVSGAYGLTFGLAAVIRGATDELAAQVKVGAQVQAVLRSTAGVAGVTARQVDALAKAELRKTGIDDEVVKGAEAVLLRFTQVRNVAGEQNDIFDRATKTSLDLAAALGRDATDAAFALGKALQDPTRGVQHLRRVGAAFTVDEAKQIKTLAEHGHVLEAQKKILDSLAISYGGTAEKVGNATPWNRLRETLKNLTAEGIRPLLPEFNGLVDQAQKWADHLENDAGAQQKLTHNIHEALGVAKDFITVGKQIAGALGGWKQTIEILVALKFASTVAGWTSSLRALIGTEAAGAAASGLAGAEAKASGLAGTLGRLSKIGPIAITIALSFVPKSSKGQTALDKAGIGFLGHLPIVGSAFQQEAALEAKLFGPSWGAGTQPGETPVQAGPDASKTGTAVATYAKRYGVGSGIRYHWAGVSPVTGFDCSGFLWAAYQSAGVNIPRDTRSQWNDPHAIKVAPGEERPGDAVYFHGSLTGKNAGPPPGHVGIYLGGGIYVEYFSEGKPAATSTLSRAVDYMGARRWAKISEKKGAAPPTGGDTGSTAAANPLPTKIRQSIAAANVALAAAALTPGKADDRAAIAQSKRALEDEIAWLNAKLATKLGPEKRITLEDLLTGALGDLAALAPGAKKKAGAGVGAITSLRNIVAQDLKGLPAVLDDVEQQAVTKLKQLRDRLKVGMSTKDLADTRAGIKNWGTVLKNEIARQAQAAATAAQEAARLWQRGWQNDVDRVLRDFQENVVQKRLDEFDRDTAAGLRAIQAKYSALTPEEQALSDFQAQRAAAEAAKRKADLQAEIADVNKQLAALDEAAVTGTLINIDTGERTPITGDQVLSKREELLKQLADLQEQYQQLQLDDQEAALQSAADASRRAQDEKEQAAQDAYQRDRDQQRQALSDLLDDQSKALSQDLDDWNLWLTTKAKNWLAFIQFLKDNGIDTANITNPVTPNLPNLADLPAPATGTEGVFGAVGYFAVNPPGYADGGRVGGRFYGRNDTVLARLTPGERVLDRRLNEALERAIANGAIGGSGPVVAVFKIDGREFARATAQPMSDEQARLIGYQSYRS